ncbi:MAG: non-canonical purine NTP pyrophosphatase [Clostridia bacterium]|nr:non-canonical purine NTP pyrophosphatase [Clostridia bacterium]
MSQSSVLIGTSNPSKVGFFTSLLDYPGIQCLTPGDLGIHDVPDETGTAPLENAIRKAEFYAHFHPVVCATDSGLFFDSIPPDDPRQPGLHLRSPYGHRLSDEEMLAYYAGLVRGLGGSVTAYYMDAFAFIVNGQLYTFEPLREELLKTAFTLRGTPVSARTPGWPLDSISFDQSGCSFTDPNRVSAQQHWGYMPRLRACTRDILHRHFPELVP